MPRSPGPFLNFNSYFYISGKSIFVLNKYNITVRVLTGRIHSIRFHFADIHYFAIEYDYNRKRYYKWITNRYSYSIKEIEPKLRSRINDVFGPGIIMDFRCDVDINCALPPDQNNNFKKELAAWLARITIAG
jgi:hypothetical protein